MMGNSSLRIWLCGIAIGAAALSGMPAGAASPTVPGAPKITSVKPDGDRQLEIAFTKPANDGGSRVSSFRGRCTSSNGGAAGTHSATHSPVLVPGLSAGKTYRCTVTAGNAIGFGHASAPSSPVVAHPTTPGPPKVTSVKAVGLRTLSVAVSHPTSDGGATVLFYRATCTSPGGATRSSQASQSPVTVTGLTAAVTYKCTVAAGNNIGLGHASAPSSPAVPRPKAPGAPKITAIKSAGQLSVAVGFVKPADDGGAPITSYLVRCTSSNGGAKRSRAAAKSAIRVVGLTQGKTYRCTVAASNNVRRGPPSAPSKAIVARP